MSGPAVDRRPAHDVDGMLVAMTTTTWVIGCGDVGTRAARLLRDGGRAVRAIVRTPAHAVALDAGGTPADARDLDDDAPWDDLRTGDDVLWLAPPPDRGTTDPRLRRFLGRAGHAIGRLVYISTTGVYGDCEGRWIDESEPLAPRTDRGKRRLDAEQALSGGFGPSGIVLRVPGIYGPGRLPVERLRKGVPVVNEAQSPWSNRIHSDDLAGILVAALERGAPGRAYNASDGHPTSMTDYFVSCARLLGLPEPPRVTLEQARATFTPAMLSFLEESRRVSNRRIIGELEVVLRYPSLAEGLPACLP